MKLMNVTAVYLVSRFLYRIIEFARHWYVKSFHIYFDRVLTMLGALDRSFALKITAKNLFKPLYQDYSIIGYIMGFIFRSFRLIVAAVFYGAILLAATAVYFIWLLIPPYLLMLIVR